MKTSRRQFTVGAAATMAGAAFMPHIALAAPKKLVMQTGSPSPNSGFIPFFVAKEQGFFAEEGLDVEVRYTRGANVAMQLISAGQADLGFFVYDSLIVGYGQGLRGTYFYQYYTQPIFLIGVKEGGPISSIADLAGKRIGVASLGSAGVPIGKSMLRAANVDPNSVTFVPIGVGNQAYVALNDNQVEAVSLWDAALGGLEVLGAKMKYFEHPKLKDIGSGGYVASQTVFKERQPDLVGFGRAMAKATAFTLANPEAGIRIYWKANPAGKPSGSEDEAVKKTLAEIRLILRNVEVPTPSGQRPTYGQINLDSLQQYIEVNAVELQLKSPPKASDIADPKLVAEINKFDLEAIKAKAKAWKG